MARPVVWSPEAERDLIEIWSYLAGDASPDTADRWLFDIADRADGLSDWPLIGRARDELRPGIRSVALEPYVIFYRLADTVEIVRVLHGGRDIDTIFSEP